MKFEDLHDYNGSSAYLVPNEDVSVWRDMLKGLYIQRAAGICSAGEVGFFAMLPTVREELVLVDHCYPSLGVAMYKYLLLKKYGWGKAQKLVTGGGPKLAKALADIHAELPGKVGTYKAPYDYGISTPHGRLASNGGFHKEWKGVPGKLGKSACTKLDKVSFLHGDLRDLAQKGPFDLLYLSNAMQHLTRDRKNPVVSDLTKLVKPGGYILACWDRYASAYAPGKGVWEQVAAVQNTRSDPYGAYSKMVWNHGLFRTKTEDLVAAA